MSDSVILWTAAHQASLSFTISWSLLKLMFIEVMTPSNLTFSVAPFSCGPQSFPASGSFPVSQLFTSSGVSASVLPMNIQGGFPLGLNGLISLLSKGLSRVFSNTTVWRHQLFSAQPSLCSSSHITSTKPFYFSVYSSYWFLRIWYWNSD